MILDDFIRSSSVILLGGEDQPATSELGKWRAWRKVPDWRRGLL